MNLRESFQYMNFLDDKLRDLGSLLYDTHIVTKTVEHHYKSRAVKDAEDEIKDIVREEDYDPQDLLDLMEAILTEKEALSTAIYKAKNKAEINIDHAVSINKAKQKYAKRLKWLSELKSSEKESTGKAYMINNEGNQTSYCYDVKRVTTIDYDRNKVKKAYKAITKECEEMSTLIDKVQINTEVIFEPKFDLSDTIEDMLDK